MGSYQRASHGTAAECDWHEWYHHWWRKHNNIGRWAICLYPYTNRGRSEPEGTNATSGNSTTGGTTEINATSTTGGGGGNQTTASQVRLHIEEACIAAQNNDTEGLLMQLNLALNALEGAGTQGNTTTAISAGDFDTTTTAGEEQLAVGRTTRS